MTAKEIADLFEQLELHLIASLKRNLMRHKQQEQDEGGTDDVSEHWEMWQSAKLRDIRRFRRENQQILGQYSPVIEAETEALLREQYAEGNAQSFFHSSDERLNSLIREMQHNEVRVERAALRYMNDVYRKTVLRTATAMNTGGMTLRQATDEATKDFLAQGINCVQYANGRRVNIASYAEMALRACSTRAMLMGEAKQRERLGLDTVLVSQYGACSDTCLPWQGLVYIDDVFQDYHGPRGGSFGVSRNGRQYMFLSIAIQGGLFHPNCRHMVSTWIEGISTMPKQIPPEQIEKVNKLERQQRKLELEVRRAKREVAGLTDGDARKAANAKVREKQAKLREFIREHNDVLRRDYWRERDTGVPEDQGTPEKPVEISEKPATMNSVKKEDGVVEVRKIADIDIDKYSVIAPDIRSSTLVLTENQKEHIIKRRGQEFYDKYEKYFGGIATDPDYIFSDKAHPNTAIACKTLEVDGINVHLVIRLAVQTDDPSLQNSVITVLVENNKRYAQRLRNNKPLYKKE